MSELKQSEQDLSLELSPDAYSFHDDDDSSAEENRMTSSYSPTVKDLAMKLNDAKNESVFKLTNAVFEWTAEETEDINDIKHHEDILSNMYYAMKNSAIQHIIEIKKRLINDKNRVLSMREEYYLEQLRLKQQNIDYLNEALSNSEKNRSYEINYNQSILDKYSILYSKKIKLYISKTSLIKILHTWRHEITVQIQMRRLFSIVAHTVNKTTVRQVFNRMRAQRQYTQRLESQHEWKQRLDFTTRSIVEKYELELNLLRHDLSEAHLAVRQEQLRRHQLEEDLRRMFLKNMTVMNMEALTLFKVPATTSTTTTTTTSARDNFDCWTAAGVPPIREQSQAGREQIRVGSAVSGKAEEAFNQYNVRSYHRDQSSSNNELSYQLQLGQEKLQSGLASAVESAFVTDLKPSSNFSGNALQATYSVISRPPIVASRTVSHTITSQSSESKGSQSSSYPVPHPLPRHPYVNVSSAESVSVSASLGSMS